ncbi:hypothetical protein PG990_010680 [Apiospora arundinis]
MGVGCGSPLAIACTHHFPKSVLAGTGTVCGAGAWAVGMEGIAWFRRLLLYLRANAPSPARSLIDEPFVLSLHKRPDKFCRYIERDSALKRRTYSIGLGPDGALPANLNIEVDYNNKRFLKAFRGGAEGIEADGRILVGDWGFELQDVDSNAVRIYWGDQDTTVARAEQVYMAKKIRNATLTIFPGDSDYSIPFRYYKKILGEILVL